MLCVVAVEQPLGTLTWLISFFTLHFNHSKSQHLTEGQGKYDHKNSLQPEDISILILMIMHPLPYLAQVLPPLAHSTAINI
jgi:hypothetical protein